MKNKKSKIIVPALGLILLSTAASISGSVAWFTANRTATINATSFAVVKTSENLTCALTNGVGTATVSPVGSTAGSITTTSGYTLTDSSFNHTQASAPILPVIEPNNARDKVATATALASLDAAALVRDSVNNVYSAFTWDMAFTISFSESAIADQGLFIDLSTSYMHEKVHFAKGDEVPGDTYWASPECTGNKVASTTVSDNAGADYYKLEPDHSGKAFRIAFVPLSITGTGTQTSVAYTKVWAKHDGSAEGSGKFVSEVTADEDLTEGTYGTATTQLSGYTGNTSYTAAAAGSGKVLMEGSEAIPEDATINASTALSGNANYLGVFKKDPGKTVILTYRCVAWFEGTHPEITSATTDFETIVAGMTFGVCNLL